MIAKLYTGLFCLLVSPIVWAGEDGQTGETRSALISQMETAGQNEFEDERHAVKVDDCQLTTYRWKHVDGDGWVLWTSFELPMLRVALSKFHNEGREEPFAIVKSDAPMVLMVLTGKDGFEFTHEKPFLRTPKGEYQPSPRGDGTTHFTEKKSRGAIIQTGPGVIEKARIFTNAYLRYVQQFCTFIG